MSIHVWTVFGDKKDEHENHRIVTRTGQSYIEAGNPHKCAATTSA